jgi:hypothetical protein
MNSSTPIARNVFLFLAALLSTFGALRTVAPEPSPMFYKTKFDLFRENKDDYDILIFGTSRPYSALKPKVIDRAFAAEGARVKTFNFAMFGTEPFEIDHMIQRVLDLEPKRLKCILVEWVPWNGTFRNPANAFTDRSIYWHTPEYTKAAIESTWISPGTWKEKLDLTLTHLHLLSLNISSFGQLKPYLESQKEEIKNKARRDFVESLRQQRGFASPQSSPDVSAISPPMGDVREFKTAIRNLDARNQDEVDLTSHNYAAHRRQLERVQSAGVRLIYMSIPSAFSDPMPYRLTEAGEIPEFLGLNNIAVSEVVYKVENYWNDLHVNQQGAVIASEILGKHLVDLWERGKSKAGDNSK